MAPPLTIRNLSSVPLHLKLVERYSSPSSTTSSNGLNLASFGRNFTSLVSSTTPAAPTAPELAANADSFSKEEVDISIRPFASTTTAIAPVAKAASDILRLTFGADGQRYRIDVPAPTKSSLTLKPLAPSPKHAFSAVFTTDEGTTHLAILSSTKLDSWMANLDDATPLTALSIPGTHNSPTHQRALPSVRCQAVSPKEQLQNGVRFFDVRVQPEAPDQPARDGLILVHGVFPVSLTGTKYLKDLLADIRSFLHDHPSETLVLSLKREGAGNATDAQLARILHDHYLPTSSDTHSPTEPDPQRGQWWIRPRVPTLGEARGKIVLLRRFALDEAGTARFHHHGWGLDAESWAYNTAHDAHGAVCVQDYCEVLEPPSVARKIALSHAQLARAAQCVCAPTAAVSEAGATTTAPGERPRLYLNFLSAANFWKVGCWPERIAEKLNPAVTRYLCERHGAEGEEGDGSTGVVVCDWVGTNGDWDLVRCIVAMNAKLEMREKAARAVGMEAGEKKAHVEGKREHESPVHDDHRHRDGHRGGRGGGRGGHGGRGGRGG